MANGHGVNVKWLDMGSTEEVCLTVGKEESELPIDLVFALRNLKMGSGNNCA